MQQLRGHANLKTLVPCMPGAGDAGLEAWPLPARMPTQSMCSMPMFLEHLSVSLLQQLQAGAVTFFHLSSAPAPKASVKAQGSKPAHMAGTRMASHASLLELFIGAGAALPSCFCPCSSVDAAACCQTLGTVSSSGDKQEAFFVQKMPPMEWLTSTDN